MSQAAHRLLRWLPLFILLVGIALFLYFKLYRYLTFEQLTQHRQLLEQWTAEHYFLAILVFMISYILFVAFSIPGATFLTLISGFLFGIIQGTFFVVIAATLGASILFLAVKTSLGSILAKQGSRWIVRLEEGFQENAFSYLLVLRLLPLFPFWIINIVAGLLNVPLRTFSMATLIGIVPGTLIFVAIGHGLGGILDKGGSPNFSIIFSAPILLPLIGLSILSVMPILYKKYKAKQHA